MLNIEKLIENRINEELCLNPEHLWNNSQINNVITALNEYGNKNKCEAVVAATYNALTGSNYFILSKKIAKKQMQKDSFEKMVKFYTISDYEKLRIKEEE